MYWAKGICIKGVTTPKLIATTKGIPLTVLRNSREKGKLRIARILILDEYATFLETLPYATVVLPEDIETLCRAKLSDAWFSQSKWSVSKFIAALAKSNWRKFLSGIPKLEEGEMAFLNAHNHRLRRVMNLSKAEFKILNPIGEFCK